MLRISLAIKVVDPANRRKCSQLRPSQITSAYLAVRDVRMLGLQDSRLVDVCVCAAVQETRVDSGED